MDEVKTVKTENLTFVTAPTSPQRIKPVPTKLVNSRWYETMNGQFYARSVRHKSAIGARSRIGSGKNSLFNNMMATTGT